MSSFSRGARVRLRSGSPDLCVTGVFGELSGCPMVAVAWYTQAGELHRADLPADSLELSPPTTQPAGTRPSATSRLSLLPETGHADICARLQAHEG